MASTPSIACIAVVESLNDEGFEGYARELPQVEGEALPKGAFPIEDEGCAYFVLVVRAQLSRGPDPDNREPGDDERPLCPIPVSRPGAQRRGQPA